MLDSSRAQTILCLFMKKVDKNSYSLPDRGPIFRDTGFGRGGASQATPPLSPVCWMALIRRFRIMRLSNSGSLRMA